MYNEIDLDRIDLTQEAPAQEPVRQYYFMAKCRKWVQEFETKNKRRPTACIQTFGCQMNERDSEKMRGILENIGYELKRAYKRMANLVVGYDPSLFLTHNPVFFLLAHQHHFHRFK